MTTRKRTITKPTATCPHCGESFRSLKDGKIPTHDFPKPCRSVCRGSGCAPKDDPDTPLWKDDPSQEAKDVFSMARQELLIVGFAVVKDVVTRARQAGSTSGTTQCPLCLGVVRFAIASSNGHLWAQCQSAGCINAVE